MGSEYEFGGMDHMIQRKTVSCCDGIKLICGLLCVQVDNDSVQVRPPLLRVRLDTLTSIMSDIDTSDDEEENEVGPLDVLSRLVSLQLPTFLNITISTVICCCLLVPTYPLFHRSLKDLFSRLHGG